MSQSYSVYRYSRTDPHPWMISMSREVPRIRCEWCRYMDDTSLEPYGKLYLSYDMTSELYEYRTCLRSRAREYATSSLTISVRSDREVPDSCCDYWYRTHTRSDEWVEYSIHMKYECSAHILKYVQSVIHDGRNSSYIILSTSFRD